MNNISPICTSPRGTAELAALFKAPGNPVRLRIVEQLTEGERCVCELHADSGREQSTVSHHLNVLRRCGVVVCEQRGKNVFYRLAHPAENPAAALPHQLLL